MTRNGCFFIIGAAAACWLLVLLLALWLVRP
jgi:hypothetical protein